MSVETRRKYWLFGPEVLRVRTAESEWDITINKKSHSVSISNKFGEKMRIYFGPESESEFMKRFQSLAREYNLKKDYNPKTIRNFAPDELKTLAQFELILACLNPYRRDCLETIMEPLLSMIDDCEQDIYAAYEAFSKVYAENYFKYDVPKEVESHINHNSPFGICDW